MGRINEELVLTDGFTAAFSRFLTLGQTAVARMERIDQTCNNLGSTMRRSIGHATGAVIGNMRQLGNSINEVNASGFDRLEAQLQRIVQNTSRATTEQSEHTRQIERANSSADKLCGTLRRVVSVAAAFKIGKDLIELSDATTNMTARIDLMNDGLQTTEQLQKMIYDSAQRVGASYTETSNAIAKMGLNAGSAFDSNAELVAFMENINKEFVIGGTSAQGMESAMLQLTQAMASGALRGEELNAILDSAPGIARNIERYMGWAEGSIKSYAEEGAVTAQVVKNAMLDSTEEINKRFEKMPMTWSRALQIIKNSAIRSFDKVSEKINKFIDSDTGQKFIVGITTAITVLAAVVEGVIDLFAAGADFVAQHWDIILPILIGIGVALIAMGVYGVISGIATMIAWGPVSLIFLAIVVVVALLVYWLIKSGTTCEEIGEKIGRFFGLAQANAYNAVAFLRNVVQAFREFLANVFEDPVNSIKTLFYDLFYGILTMVNQVAIAIDEVLGTSLSSGVTKFQEKLNNWAAENLEAQKIKYKRYGYVDTSKYMDDTGKKGAEAGKKVDDFINGLEEKGEELKDLLNGGGGNPFKGLGNIDKVGTVGTVKKIEKDVNIADEDIKMLRDLSERQYIANVNLTVPTTNLSVNQTVTNQGASDIEMISNALRKEIEKQRVARA